MDDNQKQLVKFESFRHFLSDTLNLDSGESDIEDKRSNDGEDDDRMDIQEHNVIITDMESEQEMSEDDENFADSNDDLGNYFLGRDKVTKWRKGSVSSETKKENNDWKTDFSEVTGPAVGVKTPYDSWKCFFDDEMLKMIVENTNKFINLKRTNYARENDAKVTDVAEIKAFIGLLYLTGVLKSNRLNIKELWASDLTGVEMFRTVMNQKRFRFLLSSLRFADVDVVEKQKKNDKFCEIRDLFQRFASNCQNAYSVGDCVTVGERLEAFKGHCPFKQYTDNRSKRCGVKMYAMVDSKLGYVFNLDIYTGKHNGPYPSNHNRADALKILAWPILGTGRNITTTYHFTSIELANELLRENLTLVGTIKKNRKQIPSCFINTRGRAEKSSLFGFENNCTLMSYVPSRGKNILLLSTKHREACIDPTTEDKIPEILTYYNATKSGIDFLEELCSKYDVTRSTRQWPMIVFFSMLNIAGINSQIIYIKNKNSDYKYRKHFLRRLAVELVGEYLEKRSQCKSLRVSLREKIKEHSSCSAEDMDEDLNMSQFDEDITCLEETSSRKRKRCETCKRGKNRMTRYRCKSCSKYICLEHTVFYCHSCADDK